MATPLMIANLPFQCTSLAEADFSDRAAVYVVICVAKDRTWSVLDVGQSGRVGSRIDEHKRRECWIRNCPSGNTWVCVYSMPSSQHSEQDRLNLEHRLRVELKPTCGER